MVYFIYRNLMRIIPSLLKWAGIFNAKLEKRNLGLANQVVPVLDGCIWIHSASLGEFEQGKRVIDALRIHFPQKLLVLTFFSSSGFDKRKDYSGVDYVLYLPYDSPKEMDAMVRNLRPELVVFVKYEFWFNLLDTLCRDKIPYIFISSVFSSEQYLFRPPFQSLLQKLRCSRHIFVQNQTSWDVLQNHGFQAVTLAGDTRIDRVIELRRESFDHPNIRKWIGDAFCVVVGSSWPADEELLSQCIGRFPDWKWLIAPHELGHELRIDINKRLGHKISFLSDMEKNDQPETLSNAVLVIDRIGLLSRIYRYGDIAYIGGGFGAGIHNTLEPAVYGLPLIFGPKYEKFQEAIDFIELKAAEMITTSQELHTSLELYSDDFTRKEIRIKLNRYFDENQGATELIMKTIENTLST